MGGFLKIIVSEIGWPSEGGSATSFEYASTYNSNLIRHVKGGTPKRPNGPIETYMFSMFNENLKTPDYEKNLGSFIQTNSLNSKLSLVKNSTS